MQKWGLKNGPKTILGFALTFMAITLIVVILFYVKNIGGDSNNVWIILISTLGSIASFFGFFIAYILSANTDSVLEQNTEILKRIISQATNEQLITDLTNFFKSYNDKKCQSFISLVLTPTFADLFHWSKIIKETDRVILKDAFTDISKDCDNFFIAYLDDDISTNAQKESDDNGVHNTIQLANAILHIEKNINFFHRENKFKDSEIKIKEDEIKRHGETLLETIEDYLGDRTKLHKKKLSTIPFNLFIGQKKGILEAYLVFIGSYNVEGLARPSGLFLTDQSLILNLISVFGTITGYDKTNEQFKKIFNF